MSRAHFPVTALGPGRRLGIWLQGCPLACAGCMSLDTWPADGGTEVAIADLVALWRRALASGATGMTVSGGEPLAQAEPLRRLLTSIRACGGPTRPDVLLYTGYELDELDDEQLAAVDLADAVITGRYRVAEPTTLVWRGSENQRLLPRTPLGVERYATHADAHDAAPLVQVAADGRRLFIIGVPPPGALSRMEREMRAQGIHFEEVAWRP